MSIRIGLCMTSIMGFVWRVKYRTSIFNVQSTVNPMDGTWWRDVIVIFGSHKNETKLIALACWCCIQCYIVLRDDATCLMCGEIQSSRSLGFEEALEEKSAQLWLWPLICKYYSSKFTILWRTKNNKLKNPMLLLICLHVLWLGFDGKLLKKYLHFYETDLHGNRSMVCISGPDSKRTMGLTFTTEIGVYRFLKHLTPTGVSFSQSLSHSLLDQNHFYDVVLSKFSEVSCTNKNTRHGFGIYH